MGSTEIVALVFTDLVGSTSLLSSLGEEAGDTLRQVHLGLLRDGIAARDGREVKNLGDGIMAAFPTASDAVAGAVAVQQAIDRHNRRTDGPELRVRVGVATGEVTRDDDDYFGTPVVEAARLCGAADGGEILVTEIVRSLAGRSEVEYEPVGSLELKGLPEPVAANRVRWEQSAATALPMPPRMRAAMATGFVGREDERAVLQQAWKEAQSGTRRTVFLAGEPGLGKTTCAAEFAGVVHGEGATVLFGRCDEDLGLAYQPFVEALRHYVTVAPDEELAAHVAAHGGELTRLVPELTRRVDGVPEPRSAEAETERYLLFDAVAGVLTAAARTEPLLLVLDDLHWARKPTILLLRHVLAATHDERVLVVGTYRDTDLTSAHPLGALLADLRREEGVSRVRLRGLSDRDVVAYAEALAGHELDERVVQLAHDVAEGTGGSPFFVSEIVRNLVESGAVFERDGRWTFEGDSRDLDIPESVREVIERRVRRLPDGAEEVLAVAAVVGTSFDLSLVAALSERTEEAVLDLLEAAVVASLVEERRDEPGRFAFAHNLIRDSLYSGLSATRRVRLHRRAAEQLESRAEAGGAELVDELAHHWIEATLAGTVGVEDVERAAARIEDAARSATANLAHEEAARLYAQALDLAAAVPDDTRDARLLVAAAEAEGRAGNQAAAKVAAARAAGIATGIGRPDLLGAAALAHGCGLGGVSFGDRLDEELVELLEAAIEAVGESGGELSIRLLSRLAMELYFSPEAVERRARLSSRALELARELGDPHVELVALYTDLWANIDPDAIAQQLDTAQYMERLAEELGDTEMAYRAGLAVMRAAMQLGSPDWKRHLDRCQRLADELRQPLYRWQTTMLGATAALSAGRHDEAESLSNAAVQIADDGLASVAMTAWGIQFAVHRWATGRVEEALAVLEPEAQELTSLPALRAGVAFLQTEDGDLDGAAELLRGFVSPDGRIDVPRDGSWLTSMWLLGYAAAAVREPALARPLYDALLPYRSQVAVAGTGTVALSSLSSPLGALAHTLGRHEEASAHFAAAVERNRAFGCVPFHALSEREHLRLLVELGDAEAVARARAVGDEALAASRAAGMPAMERSILELASRL